MANVLSEVSVQKALDWAYEKAINGLPGTESAAELAESYMKNGESKLEQANSLIRWQNSKAGTSGFLTGLGGAITMPVTIPANLASILYIQLRMIAAIAHIGGCDIKDDRIKALAFMCLAGNSAKDIAKDAGIVIGTKVTTNAIKNISGHTIATINKMVGFRLLTKFGEKGVINLGKLVPLVGGVIGGSVDAIATNLVGNTARDTFIGKGRVRVNPTADGEDETGAA